MSSQWFPAAVLAVVLLPPPARARAQEASDARTELEVMEAVLDNAIRRVSRPSAAPFLGGGEASRGYRLRGYGAVFVVPPRALPRGDVLVFHGGPPAAFMQWSDEAAPAMEDIEGALAQLRDQQQRLEREIQKQEGRKGVRGARQRELQAIEAKVETLQREAERLRQDAERALEETVREFRFRMASVPPPPANPQEAPTPRVAPVADTPPVPAAPTAPPAPIAPVAPVIAPAPPWRFWFNTNDGGDPRTAEKVVSDVRAVVTQVLEAYGARLKVVRSEEFVTVAVDFVPQSGFFDEETRAEKTLIVRVRKKELEDRAASRIPPEELHKRIEYVEY
jgi:hypothetical protein